MLLRIITTILVAVICINQSSAQQGYDYERPENVFPQTPRDSQAYSLPSQFSKATKLQETTQSTSLSGGSPNLTPTFAPYPGKFHSVENRNFLPANGQNLPRDNENNFSPKHQEPISNYRKSEKLFSNLPNRSFLDQEVQREGVQNGSQYLKSETTTDQQRRFPGGSFEVQRKFYSQLGQQGAKGVTEQYPIQTSQRLGFQGQELTGSNKNIPNFFKNPQAPGPQQRYPSDEASRFPVPSSPKNSDQEETYDEGDYSAIPGEPGKDYPIHSYVPQTSFKCSDQQYPGYYSDVEAQCQVFHICTNQQMYDFLCPNGTIFSQEFLVCVWWNQFDCNAAPSYYEINAHIYDYTKSGKNPVLHGQETSSAEATKQQYQQEPGFNTQKAGYPTQSTGYQKEYPEQNLTNRNNPNGPNSQSQFPASSKSIDTGSQINKFYNFQRQQKYPTNPENVNNLQENRQLIVPTQKTLDTFENAPHTDFATNLNGQGYPKSVNGNRTPARFESSNFGNQGFPGPQNGNGEHTDLGNKNADTFQQPLNNYETGRSSKSKTNGSSSATRYSSTGKLTAGFQGPQSGGVQEGGEPNIGYPAPVETKGQHDSLVKYLPSING